MCDLPPQNSSNSTTQIPNVAGFQASFPDLKKKEALEVTFKNSLGIEFVLVGKGTGWLGGQRREAWSWHAG